MTIRTRRVKRVVTEHKCVVCGNWFLPKRSDAAYCSARCRVRAHRAREGKPERRPEKGGKK